MLFRSLKPHAHALVLKPHVRLWGDAAAGGSRASGHVDVEGFVHNSVLRLSGFSFRSPERLPDAVAVAKVAEVVDHSLAAFLRATFPDRHVTLSPATHLGHAATATP